ncbi:MAG: superoxide dismutase family protein [Clostridia bacterium]|nr:superoxide dismutase family protein [Clostridia bacterium]
MMLQNFDAVCYLSGSEDYPSLTGTVGFRGVRNGTWVEVEAEGLPLFQPGAPQIGPHGFHIHNGNACGEGFGEDPFAAADGHWNPENQPHGNHPGDFPVLFSNGGRAAMLFFTDRFLPEDVIGKTLVLHASPDDYQTQPAGGSGKRIACGVILAGK